MHGKALLGQRPRIIARAGSGARVAVKLGFAGRQSVIPGAARDLRAGATSRPPPPPRSLAALGMTRYGVIQLMTSPTLLRCLLALAALAAAPHPSPPRPVPPGRPSPRAPDPVIAA